MPVRLRLSMHGRTNAKIFHLAAANSSKRRNAKPIEPLGVFNPRADPETNTKTMEWSVDRIRYWLEKGGARPTKPVVRLLERGGIIPANSKYHPKKVVSPPAPAPIPEYTEEQQAAIREAQAKFESKQQALKTHKELEAARVKLETQLEARMQARKAEEEAEEAEFQRVKEEAVRTRAEVDSSAS